MEIVGVAVLGGILLTGGYVLAEDVLPQDGTVLYSQWKEALVRKWKITDIKEAVSSFRMDSFRIFLHFKPEKKEVLKITSRSPTHFAVCRKCLHG